MDEEVLQVSKISPDGKYIATWIPDDIDGDPSPKSWVQVSEVGGSDLGKFKMTRYYPKDPCVEFFTLEGRTVVMGNTEGECLSLYELDGTLIHTTNPCGLFHDEVLLRTPDYLVVRTWLWNPVYCLSLYRVRDILKGPGAVGVHWEEDLWQENRYNYSHRWEPLVLGDIPTPLVKDGLVKCGDGYYSPEVVWTSKDDLLRETSVRANQSRWRLPNCLLRNLLLRFAPKYLQKTVTSWTSLPEVVITDLETGRRVDLSPWLTNRFPLDSISYPALLVLMKSRTSLGGDEDEDLEALARKVSLSGHINLSWVFYGSVSMTATMKMKKDGDRYRVPSKPKWQICVTKIRK